MMQQRQKLDRALAVSTLKQRNETNFRNLGLLTPMFVIKFAYVPKHREDMVVSMFPSEMEKGEDVYMELTDGDNYPIHDVPVLYKLRYNPYYKGEYEVIPADPSRNKNSETYLIPVSELEMVSGMQTPVVQQAAPKQKEVKKQPMLSTKNMEMPKLKLDDEPYKEKEDSHYSELTIRDLASIFLKKPVSNKKWLNNLINNL